LRWRFPLAWNAGVVWVEAVTHPGRVACTAKVVDFATASRGGEPFEAVIAKYKEALAKSDKPARKEQLAGLKIFKSPTAMGGNTAYIFVADPIVKGEEYDITRVINEVFPSEVTDMFNKYKDSYAGRQIIPLNKLQ
jgi:hypothetical protein